MVQAVIIAIIGGAAWWWLRTRRRLFLLEVRGGVVTVTRGALPGPMLADFRSALRGVPRGRIEGLKEEGGVRVTASGAIDELLLQRLRNITMLYPISTFRASRATERSVRNVTATAVLLSLLTDRDR